MQASGANILATRCLSCYIYAWKHWKSSKPAEITKTGLSRAPFWPNPLILCQNFYSGQIFRWPNAYWPTLAPSQWILKHVWRSVKILKITKPNAGSIFIPKLVTFFCQQGRVFSKSVMCHRVCQANFLCQNADSVCQNGKIFRLLRTWSSQNFASKMP